MRNSMLFTKGPLVLAVIATFAYAGCASKQPVAQSSSEPVSYVGPAGPAGATGATGAQGDTGFTGATGAATIPQP